MASIPPPNTPNAIAQHIAKQCSQDGVKARAKAAAIAFVASAIREFSTVSGAAYFSVEYKTILASTHKKTPLKNWALRKHYPSKFTA
ncbi:hypothetical protein SUGI_1020470 [Cryptomeria japonica]|nr:hypothetical protein SUGI_1020470 [Cryptomeria japonica]